MILKEMFSISKFQKLTISSEQIINQHRLPLSKFGWPLRDVSRLIIKGKQGWENESLEILNKHIDLRMNMKKLSDIYGIDELRRWHIDSAFIPWFSQKPIFNNRIFDCDYSNFDYAKISLNKLCDLISSIEKVGFKEDEDPKKGIIVYPLDIQNKNFYVRAGNHRVAALTAIKKNIVCYFDNLRFLKKRDKLIISKYCFNYNTGIPYSNYPNLNNIENWPSVKSKIITKQNALKIYKLFCRK